MLSDLPRGFLIWVPVLMAGMWLAGCRSGDPRQNDEQPAAIQPASLPQAPNMVLLYYGFDAKGARNWTPELLRYYLAYFETQEDGASKPVDTLFDTVLWMYRMGSRRRLFESAARSQPTMEADWLECRDRLFAPGLQLDALEQAAAGIEAELGRPVQVWVILTLPYPDVRVTDWSEGGAERSWDFHSSDEHRLEAMQWYVATILEQWEQARFAHLRLLGFYWFHESHVNLRKPEEFPEAAMRNDLSLMRATARHLHSVEVEGRPLTLSWIPYSTYGGERLEIVRDLLSLPGEERFDYLMIQPNYFFPRWKKDRAELIQICENAASIGSGIEIECDESLIADADQRQKLLDYLEVIPEVHPDWNEVPAGYYQGLKTVYALATEPELRPWYEALYRFVRARKEGGPR